MSSSEDFEEDSFFEPEPEPEDDDEYEVENFINKTYVCEDCDLP